MLTKSLQQKKKNLQDYPLAKTTAIDVQDLASPWLETLWSFIKQLSFVFQVVTPGSQVDESKTVCWADQTLQYGHEEARKCLLLQ